jgi:hypothetical protein
MTLHKIRIALAATLLALAAVVAAWARFALPTLPAHAPWGGQRRRRRRAHAELATPHACWAPETIAAAAPYLVA